MPAPPPPPFSYGAVTAIAQLGADIDGEAEGDQIGRSVAVAINLDGTILAVGSGYNDGTGTVRAMCVSSSSRVVVDPAGQRHRRRGGKRP